MTTVVIVQPSYIPWRGYFHLIQKSDIFVFYDDVQYTKRDWRNRNKIKTKDGSKWITVPVEDVTFDTLIKDVEICTELKWGWKHWKAIEHAYRRSSYFSLYKKFFEDVYSREWKFLSELDIFLTLELCKFLGIDHVQFYQSSDLGVGGNKTDKLVQICSRLGATHYLSGPSAKNYIENDKFEKIGVTLEYMEYNYPDYPQLHGEFDPNVSVIDLLFNCGPDAPKYIWGKRNE